MTPIWKWIPPGLAHSLSPWALSIYASFLNDQPAHWRSFSWKGLHFRNPLGIAGGVDKNGELLPVWEHLGTGFIEIGTVTPQPQKPNAGKIVNRQWQDQALWNRMGFPSQGADEVYFNLLSDKPRISQPLFVNIGKNRTTPNDQAIGDYLYLVDRLQSLADVFVVNVSSPNTKDLRELEQASELRKLLTRIVERSPKPVLVKLSPDLQEESLKQSLEAAAASGISGFILTNTTTQRNPGSRFPAEGGVSGKPLAPLAKKALRSALQFFGKDRENYLFVSAGGVVSPQDVFERLEMGAQLVQTYSGLIFTGPDFFRKTAAMANKGSAL